MLCTHFLLLQDVNSLLCQCPVFFVMFFSHQCCITFVLGLLCSVFCPSCFVQCAKHKARRAKDTAKKMHHWALLRCLSPLMHLLCNVLCALHTGCIEDASKHRNSVQCECIFFASHRKTFGDSKAQRTLQRRCTAGDSKRHITRRVIEMHQSARVIGFECTAIIFGDCITSNIKKNHH